MQPDSYGKWLEALEGEQRERDAARELILRIVTECNGDRLEIARQLGVSHGEAEHLLAKLGFGGWVLQPRIGRPKIAK